MPGVSRLPIADAVEEAGEALALGIPAVILFGIPSEKDAEGSGAWDQEGIVQLAARAIKHAHPDLIVIADLCLCEYTDHGHCGVLRARTAVVDNDATLELLARTAVSQAARRRRHRRAERHDGRPRRGDPRGARRATASATRRSSPTRPSSPPRSTDRSAKPRARPHPSATGAATRWIPANGAEALREARLDIEEGADMVMVKPALPTSI